MFGLLAARSSMIFEARNSSRRWTIVSSSANLEMKIESSIAESPPPITATSSPLKKAPSQTPQVETPRPRELQLAGDAEPLGLGAHREDHRLRDVLLVAEEDALDAAVGELDPVASSVMKRVPKRSAWARNSFIISGPMIPSG